MFGDISVQDLIGTDARFEYDGKTVRAVGTVKNITDPLEEFDPINNTGHFFPIQLPKESAEQDVTLKGRIDGDRKVRIGEDRLLVQRLENLSGTVLIVDMSEEELMKVDFSKVIPTGEKAIKKPDHNRSFGRYGNASDYFDSDLAIEWSGIKGKVTGTILWYNGISALNNPTAGNYLPIVLEDWFVGCPVAVGTKDPKTLAETDWIVKITDKDTPITVKYNGMLVAELDLSGADIREE